VAAAATALILAALVVWLLHSNAPSALAAEPQPARAADVSTIDEHANRSDALVAPTSAPAPTPRPDPQLLADNAPVVPAQSATAVPQAPQIVDQGALQSAMDHERARDDRERAREQTIEDARSSALAVKLDDEEPLRGNRAASVTLAEPDADSAPIGAYVLQRGMIIPASLYTPIDSTVPGIVTAQVREDVYDSSHRTLLVPAGSRLVGSYASGMTSGQARLFVGFDSIKLPNGHTISLGNMPGVDLQGVAGLGGKVDFHTGRLFSNVVLLSILGAATRSLRFHRCRQRMAADQRTSERT
jgi:type IV secretory pathway VirB10-like protein